LFFYTKGAGFRNGSLPLSLFPFDPMTEADQKIIDASLAHVRTLHTNMRSMWDGDTLTSFYYNVISGTIARNNPDVARALMAMLSEVYENTAKSHVELGKLTTGFGPAIPGPAVATDEGE
jgi:hypothetical protein